MSFYDRLLKKEEKLSLVGLGYVGMPIAVAFARKIKVVGFDLNEKKIELYKNGIDPTNEVGDDAIKNTTVEFTDDEAKFYKVAEGSKTLMNTVTSGIKVISSNFSVISFTGSKESGLESGFFSISSGSYMGIIWAFVQPLVTIVLYWFVFEKIMTNFPRMA